MDFSALSILENKFIGIILFSNNISEKLQRNL